MGANRRFSVLVIWILWVTAAGSRATKDDEQMVTKVCRRSVTELKECIVGETEVWLSFVSFRPRKMQAEFEEMLRRS